MPVVAAIPSAVARRSIVAVSIVVIATVLSALGG
jgi:hypothetical protein